jgi:hypothetical protein
MLTTANYKRAKRRAARQPKPLRVVTSEETSKLPEEIEKREAEKLAAMRKSIEANKAEPEEEKPKPKRTYKRKTTSTKKDEDSKES